MPLQVTHGPILSLDESGRHLLVFVRIRDNTTSTKRRAQPVRFNIHLVQSGEETVHGPYLNRPKKRHTCIASLPVEPGVAARYWLADENGRRLTRRFTCLPPHPDQGEVVIYQVSDAHGLNEAWPKNLLRHHRDNSPETPAVVLCVGDLWNVFQDEVGDKEALQNHYLEFWSVPAVKQLFSQIPILQMWDDWDYLGDNSCRTHTGARGLHQINRALALGVRADFMPGPRRMAPSGAAADAGYALTLAGNLMLVPDSRSLKEAVATSSNGFCFSHLDGSQHAACWGDTQLTWMKQTLTSSTDCYKLFLVSTQSFVDNLEPPAFPCEGSFTGTRDSLGLFHKWERNLLLKEALDLGLLHPDRRFVVLSGDDHTPLARRRSFWHAPYQLKTEPPVLDPHLDGVMVWEFKSGNGGRATSVFDSVDEPPIWWGGCRGDFETNPPVWGHANSRKADIGFSWKIRNVDGDRHCTVQAIMLDDEPSGPCPGHLPRTAPHVLLERDFS